MWSQRRLQSRLPALCFAPVRTGFARISVVFIFPSGLADWEGPTRLPDGRSTRPSPLITPALVEKGVAAGYGYQHQSRSIFFPGSPLGDLELVINYLSAPEAYADLSNFLTMTLSTSSGAADSTTELDSPLDQSVTRTSSDGVFQGSNNLS